MNDDLIKFLREVLETESSTDVISKMPKDFYRKIALHMKSLRNHAEQKDDTLMKRLSLKERELINRMVERILNIRFTKILAAEGMVNDANLTPEEKYLVEPLEIFGRKKKTLSSALSKGNIRHLHTVTEAHINRYKIVRFLEDIPAMAGTDGLSYGPFFREDLATLPLENSRLLERQGKVEEVYSDV